MEINSNTDNAGSTACHPLTNVSAALLTHGWPGMCFIAAILLFCLWTMTWSNFTYIVYTPTLPSQPEGPVDLIQLLESLTSCGYKNTASK